MLTLHLRKTARLALALPAGRNDVMEIGIGKIFRRPAEPSRKRARRGF
jgi:hypothetical protein